MVTRRRPSYPGRTPPAPTSVYRRAVSTASELRSWRLSERGRRWFDIALATALLLPVIAGSWPRPAAHLDRAVRRPDRAALLAPPPPGRRLRGGRGASAAQWLLVDTPLWGQVAFPVATYSVARWRGARWGLGAVAVGVAGAAVAAFDWLRGYGDGHASATVVARTPSPSPRSSSPPGRWARSAACAVRTSTRWSSAASGSSARRPSRWSSPASEERARIAREMHDVVAHGLSVMVVQADGARYAAERDPEVATRTLATIAETGREALAEMRRLLGSVARRARSTRDPTPQPRLGDIAGAGRADARRPAPRSRHAARPPDVTVSRRRRRSRRTASCRSRSPTSASTPAPARPPSVTMRSPTTWR